MRLEFTWQGYRYLPYEHLFAKRELAALFGRQAEPGSAGMWLEYQGDWQTAASRTTYFYRALAEDGTEVTPLQAVLEATAKGVADDWPSRTIPPKLTRQNTRYSAHGLHEYRGKFNPQVVRAIGNILGLGSGAWVLDPFCGSGTTLLEAGHIGWNAVGVDLNPLAVQIAAAKIAAVHMSIDRLIAEMHSLFHRLAAVLGDTALEKPLSAKDITKIAGDDWQQTLPNFEYLSAWFTVSVLAQLAAIKRAVEKIGRQDGRQVFLTILSDILRQVSLQEPADLRIRRRKSSPENLPVIPLFIEAVRDRIASIERACQHLPSPQADQYVALADSRRCEDAIRSLMQSPHRLFDAAMTSPPYATALPYIDTQRLSLAFLGLVNAKELRRLERALIGTREITNGDRCQLESALAHNALGLPRGCLALCRRLRRCIDGDVDGFRRQNRPALIYRYLAEMQQTFEQMRRLLKKGAPFALLVGRNQTTLGGREIVIDTPCLLCELAEHNGFDLQETVELDTYSRFDVHSANSIRSEALIILRRR